MGTGDGLYAGGIRVVLGKESYGYEPDRSRVTGGGLFNTVLVISSIALLCVYTALSVLGLIPSRDLARE